ncbi:DUF5071 domain-containing protein [Paenibacillus sacheonensis]|uniref:DUF5071 domain-containing protein n=1 Tax=Paenibacillus sacheonensis TaxID=742054 RepID=A0A7X4YSB3_9BACL|nr:DUF5071 domain-containing protein [Paenibacillus sacheonensis]MBM7566996.1 hypothetical protein [Paenibacillus sacheonensis]NBC71618.1 DUF5071 domain-containing protein [Paenibacillus sacheonensis]
MFHTEELVPKDKYDIEAIEKLKAIDPSIFNLQPIVGKLFEWIQDINWPIAQELCTILARLSSEEIVPQIRMILNSGDEGWQYSCIRFLIPILPSKVKIEIGPDLLRIVNTPTISEKLVEIDTDAREIYDQHFKSLS